MLRQILIKSKYSLFNCLYLSYSILQRKGERALLRVQAKPNSKANEVVEINEDYVKIALKARPIEGEANK